MVKRRMLLRIVSFVKSMEWFKLLVFLVLVPFTSYPLEDYPSPFPVTTVKVGISHPSVTVPETMVTKTE